MSFGFSIGDFLATLKLADDLKKRFSQAPKEFKAISGEIKSLWAVLHDLNDIPIDGLSTHQKHEMESIGQKGREVLLEIECKLKKYNILAFSESNWKRKALRAWSRITWDPDEVNSLRSRITSCVSLFNLVIEKINQDLTLEIGAEVHAIKLDHDIRARNQVLSWINPVNTSEKQSRVFSMRHEGTGNWVLESEQFRLWVANKDRNTLFCIGPPGAGKTVILSIIIDYLEKEYLNVDGAAVTYLYFDFQQKLDLRDILSSFLRQLLQGNRNLQGLISELSPQSGDISGRASEAEVKRGLELVISRCSQVFLLIDALDECLSRCVWGQFTTWLRELLHTNSHTDIKVLTTTRDDGKSGKWLQKDIMLEIKAEREDVERFLNANLYYLPMYIHRKPELWEYIRNQIIDSAGGIFLLAHLYLNLLSDEKNEKRARTLVNQLQSGSGAYDHAYGETMKRIEQQGSFSHDLAKRILGLITFSARPLTPLELQDAIAVEIGEPEFDETNITDLEEMTSVCAGLIVVEKNSNVVRIAHYTAQEYLKRTYQSWFPNVHDFLTNICLTYLAFDDFDKSCSTPADSRKPQRAYPFYQYAAHELGTHLRSSLGSDSLLSTFIGNEEKVSRCMHEMFGLYGNGTDRFTGLHLASFLGLEHVVKAPSSPGSSLDPPDYHNRTPLTWAAASGHDTIVTILLDHGADPNFATKDGLTPLFYAAGYGNATITRILIDRGGNVNHKSRSEETPLMLAAKGSGVVQLWTKPSSIIEDHVSVIKMLLDAGANIDHKNSRLETALYLAADNGHESAVSLLLERNAAINQTGLDIPPHPLAAAAQKGHVQISKLLLERGAETPQGCFSPTAATQTAYLYALSHLSKSVTDEDDDSFATIAHNPGSMGFQDRFGHLPLHWAASRGDDTLVHRMLRIGFSPNSKDVFGRTPLIGAVCQGRVNVVKVLLDHPDIDAEVEDKLGLDALQEAIRRQRSPNYVGCRSGSQDGSWQEITNLLKGKIRQHDETVVDHNLPQFARYLLPQQAFYEHCDVCLCIDTLCGSARQCTRCDMISSDSTSGDIVTYCGNCLQGAEACPLCGKQLDTWTSRISKMYGIRS